MYNPLTSAFSPPSDRHTPIYLIAMTELRTKQGGYFEQKPFYLSRISIPQPNLNDPNGLISYRRIVSIVHEMLQHHKNHANAEKNFNNDLKRDLEQRIAAVDAEIDQLVYQLYGLSEEEIRIVEG